MIYLKIDPAFFFCEVFSNTRYISSLVAPASQRKRPTDLPDSTETRRGRSNWLCPVDHLPVAHKSQPLKWQSGKGEVTDIQHYRFRTILVVFPSNPAKTPRIYESDQSHLASPFFRGPRCAIRKSSSQCFVGLAHTHNSLVNRRHTRGGLRAMLREERILPYKAED